MDLKGKNFEINLICHKSKLHDDEMLILETQRNDNVLRKLVILLFLNVRKASVNICRIYLQLIKNNRERK